MIPHRSLAALLWLAAAAGRAEEVVPLPGTEPLAIESEDRSAEMRAGIDRFLDLATEESIAGRERHWQRDFTSREAYDASVQANRERFRTIIGAVDTRLPVETLEFVATTRSPALLEKAAKVNTSAVRWPVFDGVFAEGLLLQPAGKTLARMVVLPDADQTPEMLAGLAPGLSKEAQIAWRLAESGCQVLVPVLIDRRDTHSGNPDIAMTNQPHREWVYRQAFDFGRHIIGYEVQKVLAAVDWFVHDAAEQAGGQADPAIGVAGYGEGALIAFYAAAIDPRIDACLVSGYFDSRQRLWEEPIYRNVWGLLDEFGDAEIASLIAPRPLVIEHSATPQVEGPPAAGDDRRDCAAPGLVKTPELASIEREIARARAFFPAEAVVQPAIELFTGEEGGTTGPGSPGALTALLNYLGEVLSEPAARSAFRAEHMPDPALRQERQLAQLVDYSQSLIGRSERVRAEFWKKAQPTSVEAWQSACVEYRDYVWDEVIGRFPPASLPPNARTRRLQETDKWTSYEVLLDVWPEVFCWGILLVPKDTPPGERRPVVVCQHGLEGVPADVVNQDPESDAYPVYKGFAAQLAERGFVTYAPHNFYRGGNEFRQLQRKLYPLKKTMFSIILAQHERHLDWLSGLDFVDPARIGFYGLSYGGFTAIRVPPLLERYALSISSAEFNDMVKKKASIYDEYSYPFYLTYEVFEFNLANTFSYGDLAGLMAPRPFMVERGHQDSVAPDEWVASEYAKVRRRYAELGIPERTEIEFFNGPHSINGEGTFKFLHRHLNWPEP